MNGRTGRWSAVLCTIVLVAACGGQGGPGSQAGPSGPAGTSGTGSPAPGAVVDPNLLSKLEAAGVAQDDATFLAATTFEVTSPSNTSAHVVERLASGDVVEFTVTVEPTDETPGTASATGSTTADEIDVYFRYVVSAEDLPDDVRQLLTAAAGHPLVAAAGAGPILTADVSFFSVTIDWALKKVQSTIRDTAIKAILDKVSPNQVGPIMTILKAAGTISKLDDLDQKLRDLLKKLDDLEECAKNPTNPLTIKQYQEDPAAKGRILEQIAEARNELVNNTIVSELGVLNGVLAGFGPKWLGYVIGPGTDWAKATLQEINQELVDQVDRAVTKCDCQSTGGGGSGGGGGGSGGSSGGGTSGGGSSGGGSASQSCKVPLTWTGSGDYSITSDGQVVFTAHITGVVWKLSPEDSGGSVSAYALESATINWTFHSVHVDGQCTITQDGAGSDSGLPDEESSGGGEAGGPAHGAEEAMLTVHWTDIPMLRPTPFYVVQTHARLHNPIVWVNSCHGPQSEFDPDVMDPSMGNWLVTPLDPFPVIQIDPGTQNETMSGTWTESISPYLSRTWSWTLAAGP